MWRVLCDCVRAPLPWPCGCAVLSPCCVLVRVQCKSLVFVTAACRMLALAVPVLRCQVVAGTVRSHAPLKDIGILKRLRQCATAAGVVAATSDLDPMQQLGLDASQVSSGSALADPVTPAKTFRDHRLQRSTKRSADREVRVPVRDIWTGPSADAAFAVAGLSATQEIRVWMARPEKLHSQAKVHVHVADLDALLRLVYIQRKLRAGGLLPEAAPTVEQGGCANMPGCHAKAC